MRHTHHPALTAAARANVEETGIDPAADVERVRAGLTKAALRAECLAGADADREGGWLEYVSAVCEAAQR